MEEVHHTYGRAPEPIKIKLIKGQKDSYGWEISVVGDYSPDMIEELQAVDRKLKELYGSA